MTNVNLKLVRATEKDNFAQIGRSDLKQFMYRFKSYVDKTLAETIEDLDKKLRSMPLEVVGLA